MSCPYLASSLNPNQQYDNPSGRNVCYAERTKTQPYVEVSRSLQQSTCLSEDGYPGCARYRRAVSKGFKVPAEGVEMPGRRWWWPFG